MNGRGVSRFCKSSGRRSPRAAWRLNSELLEPRRLMAGDIDVNNGVIYVDGDGYDDRAEVRFVGDRVDVDLWAKRANGSEDHHDLSRDIDEISKIVFTGLNGNDRMTVFVDTLDPGVNLSPVTLQFSGGNGNDVFTNAANAAIASIADGGSGNDLLTGGMGTDEFKGGNNNDTMEGRDGNDTLWGGTGNDTYAFGTSTNYHLGLDQVIENGGIDTLDFSNFHRGASIDLAIPGQQTIAPGGLFLNLGGAVIENVIGTVYMDKIWGNSAANTLKGGNDWDRIEGRGGNDTLEGGSGKDTYVFTGSSLGTDSIFDADSFADVLDFSGFSQAVTVDLAMVGSATYAVNNANLKLKLLNSGAVAEVFGSSFDDTLLGDALSNWLHGGGGNDTINGRSGRDWMYGDAGADRLTVDSLDYVWGGTGIDRFNHQLERFPLGFPLPNPDPTRYLDWGLV